MTTPTPATYIVANPRGLPAKMKNKRVPIFRQGDREWFEGDTYDGDEPETPLRRGFIVVAEETLPEAVTEPAAVATETAGEFAEFSELLESPAGEVGEGLEVQPGQVAEITPDGARVLSEEEAAAVEFPQGELTPPDELQED